jgi:hypothetical protein
MGTKLAFIYIIDHSLLYKLPRQFSMLFMDLNKCAAIIHSIYCCKLLFSETRQPFPDLTVNILHIITSNFLV